MSLDPGQVKQLTELLQAIAADRSVLAPLPEEDRIALLAAAGRVANPERHAQARLAKKARRLHNQKRRDRDRQVRATAEIRTLRAAPVFEAPAQPPALLPAGAPRPKLQRPRHCYVCKAEYDELHFFYDSMCPACGDFNHAKRFARAPLAGKTALITGGRVKIGYQASLMLLRSGARVIVTTRFPHDAALRYSREPDYADFAHRLQLHGLDLRHAPSVELLAQHLVATEPRLDILINNAAQTVRRPPGFYAHLLPTELAPVPEPLQPLLSSREALVGRLNQASPASALAPGWSAGDAALGLRSSAALSLVPYALEREGEVERFFPSGRLDADLQQVDLRQVNSWRLKLGEVATAEMLEVHLVNAVAPFILCGRLRPLLLKDRREPGHVVNVSAMEGSFSRGTKTDKHPHTNMAKAALNMLTLTSASDYAKDLLYMNAVDTGWVTDEDPVQHATRKQEELDFQPPLDVVDGAARVVDPVFHAVNSGQFVWGNFFKDYKPTAW